jgi:hypothetical protein
VATTVTAVEATSRRTTLVDVELDIVRGTTEITRRVRVPVIKRDGSYALYAAPVRVPRPDAITEPVDGPPLDGDTVTTAELTRVLEGFFAAYADGSDEALSYYSRDGRDFDGLDGGVRFGEIDEVQLLALPDDDAPTNERTVLAHVTWLDGELRDTAPYQVDLSREDGRWYVERVTAAVPPTPTEGE